VLLAAPCLSALAISAAFAVLVATLAAPTASKVAPRRTFLTRTGFVHDQVTSVDILAVERVNGLLRFLGTAHSDKAKSPRPLRHLVHDQHSLSDCPVLGEEFFQRSLRGLEGEISYIEFHDVRYICYLGHRQFSEHQPQTAYRYTTLRLEKSRSNRAPDSEFLRECKAKFFLRSVLAVFSDANRPYQIFSDNPLDGHQGPNKV
jgi:hypothetical protein